MDEAVVSSPTANSLVKVTEIYQTGPVDFWAVFVAAGLRNHTRGSKLLSPLYALTEQSQPNSRLVFHVKDDSQSSSKNVVFSPLGPFECKNVHFGDVLLKSSVFFHN